MSLAPLNPLNTDPLTFWLAGTALASFTLAIIVGFAFMLADNADHRRRRRGGRR